MWPKTVAALALCQLFNQISVQAAPTWPASIDEVEDLMVLQTGYRAPGFASIVTPCTNSPSKGFRVAAGFLRTAFHDVAAHDEGLGIDGLDASIGFEMAGDYATHNNGPAFYGAMVYMYDFFNSKASMADLVALGVYASVRSCGGPQVAVKAGRIDATGPGPNSLPDAADSKEVLVGRFAKMGFTPSEMIQLTACGHTLGGLHPGVNSAFNPRDPNAAAEAMKSGVANFDTTDAGFDNNIVTEYLDGSTTNPLVVGANEDLNSDKRVFQVDNDVTVTAMSNPTQFQLLCKQVLSKMLDKVPRAVTLSDPISAYSVKPYLINLNVVDGGASLLFSGEIRVKNGPSAANVKIVYTGSSTACTDCTIPVTLAGTANGFDDAFTFYRFSATVKSIKSFNVVVNGVTFSNNGNGFPVNDNAFVQLSSSSFSGSTAKVVIAVRNSQAGIPQLTQNVKSSYTFNKLPTIAKKSIALTKICGDNAWSYYTCTFSASTTDRLDVSIGGTVVDAFRKVGQLGSSGTVPKCPGVSTTTTTTTTQSTTSTRTTTTSSIATTTTTTSKTTSGSTSSGTTTSTSKTTSGSTGTGTTTSTTKTSSSTTTSSTTKSSSSSSTTSSSSSSSTTKTGTTVSGATTGSTKTTSSTTTTSSSSSSSSSTTSSSETTSASTTGSDTSTTSTTGSDTSTSSSTTTGETTSGTSLDPVLVTTTTTASTYTTSWAETTASGTWVSPITTGTPATNGNWDPIKTTTTTAAGEWSDWYVTTVDAVTTYCPFPTKITTNGATYTVWKPTMLTITDCPCTITVSGKGSRPTGAVEPTGDYKPPYIPDDSKDRAQKGGSALSAIYQQGANKAAPSGGTNGGNKNIAGLDLHIVVVIVTPKVTGAATLDAPTGNWNTWSAPNTYASAVATATWVNVPGASTWATIPITGAAGATPVKGTEKPTGTNWGPIATYSGAAKPLMARGEVVMAGAAAVFGAVAMVL